MPAAAVCALGAFATQCALTLGRHTGVYPACYAGRRTTGLPVFGGLGAAWAGPTCGVTVPGQPTRCVHSPSRAQGAPAARLLAGGVGEPSGIASALQQASRSGRWGGGGSPRSALEGEAGRVNPYPWPLCGVAMVVIVASGRRGAAWPWAVDAHSVSRTRPGEPVTRAFGRSGRRVRASGAGADLCPAHRVRRVAGPEGFPEW